MATVHPTPFFFQGGPIGILLLHGFTGSPPEMLPVGEYLADRGITVSGPLLPGHGTSMEDLDRCKWGDWVDGAEAALDELQKECRTVFVGGLSLGSLVTMALSHRRPDVQGLIAYAPPLDVGDWRTPFVGLLKYIIRRVPHSEAFYADPTTENKLWFYDAYPSYAAHEFLKMVSAVKKMLPAIKNPALVVYSTGDPRAKPDGAREAYERLGSTDKHLLILERCGHIITADAEWETAAERTLKFIEEHA